MKVWLWLRQSEQEKVHGKTNEYILITLIAMILFLAGALVDYSLFSSL